MTHGSLQQIVVAFSLCLVVFVAPARAEKINVWPDAHAELNGVEAKDIPTLDIRLVRSDKPTAAILVIPGGGYKHHSSGAYSHAKIANAQGVSAFVLKYRLPGNGHRYPAPLHDAQRAMRIIRANADKWNIDPDRIGVLGSSSGGHLASLLSNSQDTDNATATEDIERLSYRPAFTVLISPVITFMKPHAHWPSRVRMLGQDATDEQAATISPELLVTKHTPPATLLHGTADTLVVPENSKLYAEACKAKGVPATLHLIEGMSHTDDGDGQRDPTIERMIREIVPAGK